MREARDRLAADLRRYYGVRLSDMYTGRESITEVAHYAAHLPRGGAVAQWMGGWGAISGEEEGARRIEYAIIAVNSKKAPEQPKPPESIRAATARKKKHGSRVSRLRQQLANWRK